MTTFGLQGTSRPEAPATLLCPPAIVARSMDMEAMSFLLWLHASSSSDWALLTSVHSSSGQCRLTTTRLEVVYFLGMMERKDLVLLLWFMHS
ncbi:hypothetical protein BDA96_01G247800 [Sorghum bicolor]|uniref:Uncharacterized protein n=2 Tax=Sorghum bicolor TaxID=4558 RepID=A0A921S0K4_SORBI|nr:hypothetical protein BDA96_01G247800 [Sorghum bicolor]KXG38432.1 hypothetical protein SORBI_3001G233300 [Sorghum bicolor]